MQDHRNHKRVTTWLTPENYSLLFDECRRLAEKEGAAVHASRIFNELVHNRFAAQPELPEHKGPESASIKKKSRPVEFERSA